MGRQVFINILILCAILFQGIWASLERNKTLSDILIRKKRIVDLSPNVIEIGSIDIASYVVKITTDWKMRCGGTILSESFIITSAECVMGYLGEVFRVISYSAVYDYGQVHNVKEKFGHPGYHVGKRDNNIAMIQLEDKIDLLFSHHTSLKIHAFLVPFREPHGFFVGWGDEDEYENTGCFFNNMKRSTVNLLLWSECKRRYQEIETLFPGETCISNDQYVQYGCNGDKGGPLVFDGRLLGVMSWAGMTETGMGPTVFVNLATETNKNWIRLYVPTAYNYY